MLVISAHRQRQEEFKVIIEYIVKGQCGLHETVETNQYHKQQKNYPQIQCCFLHFPPVVMSSLSVAWCHK